MRPRFIFLILALLLVVSVIPQAYRFYSAFRFSDMQVVTGIEGPQIYNIWRFVNHHPLYTDPWTPPHAVTFYNFGFYWTYGSIARMLGANDAGIIPVARVLTLFFALVGSAATTALIWVACGRNRTPSILAVGFIISSIAWLGVDSTVWWGFTVRPDMASCSLALLGCYLYSRRLAGHGLTNAILAGASFAAAWSFKQSSIWCAVGCFVFAILIRKSFKDGLCLAAPGICIVAATKVLAPAAYWQSTVIAPSISAITAHLLIQRVLELALPNLALFAIPVFALCNRSLCRRLFSPASGFNIAVIQMLLIVSILTLAFGVIAAGREGSSRNQMFESLFSASALCAIGIVASLLPADDGAKTPERVIECAMLAMIPLPLLTILIPNVDSGRLHWHLTWLNADKYARRIQLTDNLRQFPRPLFIQDEILSLPWNSTNDTYPAATYDLVWLEIAVNRGRIHEGLDFLVAERQFATLVLPPEDPLLLVARKAGYKVEEQLNSTISAMGQNETLVVLER